MEAAAICASLRDAIAAASRARSLLSLGQVLFTTFIFIICIAAMKIYD